MSFLRASLSSEKPSLTLPERLQKCGGKPLAITLFVVGILALLVGVYGCLAASHTLPDGLNVLSHCGWGYEAWGGISALGLALIILSVRLGLCQKAQGPSTNASSRNRPDDGAGVGGPERTSASFTFPSGSTPPLPMNSRRPATSEPQSHSVPFQVRPLESTLTINPIKQAMVTEVWGKEWGTLACMGSQEMAEAFNADMEERLQRALPLYTAFRESIDEIRGRFQETQPGALVIINADEGKKYYAAVGRARIHECAVSYKPSAHEFGLVDTLKLYLEDEGRIKGIAEDFPGITPLERPIQLWSLGVAPTTLYIHDEEGERLIEFVTAEQQKHFHPNKVENPPTQPAASSLPRIHWHYLGNDMGAEGNKIMGAFREEIQEEENPQKIAAALSKCAAQLERLDREGVLKAVLAVVVEDHLYYTVIGKAKLVEEYCPSFVNRMPEIHLVLDDSDRKSPEVFHRELKDRTFLYRRHSSEHRVLKESSSAPASVEDNSLYVLSRRLHYPELRVHCISNKRAETLVRFFFEEFGNSLSLSNQRAEFSRAFRAAWAKFQKQYQQDHAEIKAVLVMTENHNHLYYATINATLTDFNSSCIRMTDEPAMEIGNKELRLGTRLAASSKLYQLVNNFPLTDECYPYERYPAAVSTITVEAPPPKVKVAPPPRLILPPHAAVTHTGHTVHCIGEEDVEEINGAFIAVFNENSERGAKEAFAIALEAVRQKYEWKIAGFFMVDGRSLYYGAVGQVRVLLTETSDLDENREPHLRLRLDAIISQESPLGGQPANLFQLVAEPASDAPECLTLDRVVVLGYGNDPFNRGAQVEKKLILYQGPKGRPGLFQSATAWKGVTLAAVGQGATSGFDMHPISSQFLEAFNAKKPTDDSLIAERSIARALKECAQPLREDFVAKGQIAAFAVTFGDKLFYVLVGKCILIPSSEETTLMGTSYHHFLTPADEEKLECYIWNLSKDPERLALDTREQSVPVNNLPKDRGRLFL